MVIEALIRDKFINKKAFRACNAASQQLYKILVIDATDQIDLIEEMIHPLSCVEEKPLNSNSPSIGQNPLFEEKKMAEINYTLS